MTAPEPAGEGRETTRPLEGVRILTVENFVAAPFASMWLADAGAEVVKVENREGGDIYRSASPVRQGPAGEPHGLGFLRLNRNKKSLTLDLKHPEGKRVFRALAGEADVVVENLRAGVMDRLGIGYADLKADRPRLIYAAISGFGHPDVMQSPYADRPAFDIVGQAMSGLMHRPEREGDRPVYLGFSLADLQGGMLAAYGILLALFQRDRTGRGQKIDVSLYDASLALNEISVAMYSALGREAKPGLHAVTAPFGTYRASDGYVVIAVLGEPIWQRFCEAIGRPDLPADPRFSDGVTRAANNADLTVAIDAWLAGRTRADAVAALLQHGVPCSEVQDVRDVFACPHVAARRMLRTLDDPAWGPLQLVGNPVKMSGVPEIEMRPPPRLGQHNGEVLRDWLRVGSDELDRLGRDGVI